MSGPTLSSRSTTAYGALAGIVAAVVALGVAELIAGVRQQWRSPVIDVGDRVIDNVSPFVKDFAIDTFGTNDKPALLIGIAVTLLAYAAIIGALSFRRRIGIGLVGIGVFGLIGAWAAVSNRAGGSLGDAVPTLVGSAVGATALWFVHRLSQPLLAGSPPADAATPSDSTNSSPRSASTRPPTRSPGVRSTATRAASRSRRPPTGATAAIGGVAWAQTRGISAVEVRTDTMPTPLLDLDGLLRGDGVLTVKGALDHATVDAAGRVLMPMLDLLALARVDADADVLMMHHADGSSAVLRIADVIDHGDVYLQLSALQLPGVAGTTWSARLRTHDLAPAAPVRSIRAMSFASFVGLA